MKGIVGVLGCAAVLMLFVVPACADAQEEVVLPVGGSTTLEYGDEGWMESGSSFNGVFAYAGISNDPANGTVSTAYAFTGCYGPYYSNGSYWFYWYAYVGVEYQCEGAGTDDVEVIVFAYTGNTVGASTYPCNNVQIDLDADTDYDGDIDADDEDFEEDQGALVALNEDDDNGNSDPDNSGDDEFGPLPEENDLERITLSLNPDGVVGGTVMLERSGHEIRIWSSPKKGPEHAILVEPSEYQVSWNMADPIERKKFTDLKGELWIEGMSKGLHTLTAFFKNSAGHNVSVPDVLAVAVCGPASIYVYGAPGMHTKDQKSDYEAYVYEDTDKIDGGKYAWAVEEASKAWISVNQTVVDAPKAKVTLGKTAPKTATAAQVTVKFQKAADDPEESVKASHTFNVWLQELVNLDLCFRTVKHGKGGHTADEDWDAALVKVNKVWGGCCVRFTIREKEEIAGQDGWFTTVGDKTYLNEDGQRALASRKKQKRVTVYLVKRIGAFSQGQLLGSYDGLTVGSQKSGYKGVILLSDLGGFGVGSPDGVLQHELGHAVGALWDLYPDGVGGNTEKDAEQWRADVAASTVNSTGGFYLGRLFVMYGSSGRFISEHECKYGYEKAVILSKEY